MVLNKYLAHAGICSRRKAADLIKQGLVKVNDRVVTDPSFRVEAGARVTLRDEPILLEEKIYLLLNKPIKYVTTVSDEHDRKTVMELVADVGSYRLYPVGRLDYMTSGLLVITNDGAFAQQLAHPKNEVEKIYQVTVEESIPEKLLHTVRDGVMLEDGIMKVDAIKYVDHADTKRVEVTIHSGKNRIIRRLFAAIGHSVIALDRIGYAGLTKKNIPLGKWRLLTESEIASLHHPISNDR